MTETFLPKVEPVSRLFLSCDLTGSTAFKQRPRSRKKRGKKQDPLWQLVFLQFYREFPQKLKEKQTRHADGSELAFDLWKAVGDELIFTCSVKSELDVYRAVLIWEKTLEAYKRDNLSKHPGLGVKGGVFLATFPGPDHESTIPRRPDVEDSNLDPAWLNYEAVSAEDRREKEKDYLFDYFGPSIDTGFRVVNRCSARYLTLSVEVALALALVHQTPHSDGQNRCDHLTLLGSMELKGVWGGRDYPVFALDLDHKDEVNQALSKFQPPQSSPEHVLALCQACYTREDWPFKMYLPDSELGWFIKRPKDPLRKYLKSAKKDSSGIESTAPEAKDSEPIRADAPTS